MIRHSFTKRMRATLILATIGLVLVFVPAILATVRPKAAAPTIPFDLSEFRFAESEPLVVSGEIAEYMFRTGPNPANYHTVTALPIVNTESLTMTGGTSYNTNLVPSTTAHEAVVNLTFGTVVGSFGTCTAQLNTTSDGVSFQTLGAAQSITITSNHINAWTIIEQTGTTSVTSGAVSATVALSFGQQSYLALACSSYGTSAPATLSVTYK